MDRYAYVVVSGRCRGAARGGDGGRWNATNGVEARSEGTTAWASSRLMAGPGARRSWAWLAMVGRWSLSWGSNAETTVCAAVPGTMVRWCGGAMVYSLCRRCMAQPSCLRRKAKLRRRMLYPHRRSRQRIGRSSTWRGRALRYCLSLDQHTRLANAGGLQGTGRARRTRPCRRRASRQCELGSVHPSKTGLGRTSERLHVWFLH